MILDRLILLSTFTLVIALQSSSEISAKDGRLETNADYQINVVEFQSSPRNKIKISLYYPDVDAAQTDVPLKHPNADRVFEILAENSGNIVDLDITFKIENQDKDKFSIGKLYTITSVNTLKSYGNEDCTEQPNLGGFVDNFLSGYGVSFTHPFNNHETARLVVGARHNFPLQTISCAQGFNRDMPDNENKFSYNVSGRFSISTTTGTTRNVHILTPVY